MRLLAEDLVPLARLSAELAARVVERVVEAAPLSEVAKQYRDWSAHSEGEAITFSVAGERIEGRLIGIDDRGLIRLETESGERTLAAGEVIEQQRVAKHRATGVNAGRTVQ